jgi:hypothetical protein
MPSLNSRKRISPLTGLFTLAALYALFLSFFGPVLDHHYAERQSDHAHIYLGRVVPDHVHPYEAPHTHRPTQETDGGTSSHAPLSDKAPNDTIYLTSYNGMGQVFPQLTVPSIYLAPNFLFPKDHRLSFATPGDDSPFQETFIAPPKKPPRV